MLWVQVCATVRSANFRECSAVLSGWSVEVCAYDLDHALHHVRYLLTLESQTLDQRSHRTLRACVCVRVCVFVCVCVCLC